jgi:hypothetical protein
MVADELVNDIERGIHRGPFSAILVFMHVTESRARGYSQTLCAAVGRMSMRERSIGARTSGDSGICH